MSDQLQQNLSSALAKALGEGEVQGLRRLSGGANMETWAFDWLDKPFSQKQPMIMRRLPGNLQQEADMGQISLEQEAALLKIVHKHDGKVPIVHHVLQQADGLGRGYIMQRIDGEALPFKLLADDRYSKARKTLAYDAGVELAKIHAIPLTELPADLPDLDGESLFSLLRSQIDKNGNVSPVHELAYHWLKENQPDKQRKVLVHGDYRNGNILVDESGMTSVLDWELAHVGSPVRDIGYFCANVWRFGSSLPAGGFGSYEQLLDGYESISGWRPSLEEIRYWEVYAALLWGITCALMLGMYRSGEDTGIERAAVGRRLTESELDILLLLDNNEIGGLKSETESDPLLVDQTMYASSLRSSGTTGADEILQAIQGLLKEDIAPSQSGFMRYQLKVANNMLSILQRELLYQRQLEKLDNELIRALSLKAGVANYHKNSPLKHQLAVEIKYGRLAADEILSYLRKRALLEMQINNPKYSGLIEARSRWC